MKNPLHALLCVANTNFRKTGLSTRHSMPVQLGRPAKTWRGHLRTQSGARLPWAIICDPFRVDEDPAKRHRLVLTRGARRPSARSTRREFGALTIKAPNSWLTAHLR